MMLCNNRRSTAYYHVHPHMQNISRTWHTDISGLVILSVDVVGGTFHAIITHTPADWHLSDSISATSVTNDASVAHTCTSYNCQISAEVAVQGAAKTFELQLRGSYEPTQFLASVVRQLPQWQDISRIFPGVAQSIIETVSYCASAGWVGYIMSPNQPHMCTVCC